MFISAKYASGEVDLPVAHREAVLRHVADFLLDHRDLRQPRFKVGVHALKRLLRVLLVVGDHEQVDVCRALARLSASVNLVRIAHRERGQHSAAGDDEIGQVEAGEERASEELEPRAESRDVLGPDRRRRRRRAEEEGGVGRRGLAVVDKVGAAVEDVDKRGVGVCGRAGLVLAQVLSDERRLDSEVLCAPSGA